MRLLVETYETLGGDVWRRMRRLVKRIRIHMCDWKNKSPGDLFSTSGKTSSHVTWSLLYMSTSGNSSVGFHECAKCKSLQDSGAISFGSIPPITSAVAVWLFCSAVAALH